MGRVTGTGTRESSLVDERTTAQEGAEETEKGMKRKEKKERTYFGKERCSCVERKGWDARQGQGRDLDPWPG